jgi:hypothetical protein
MHDDSQHRSDCVMVPSRELAHLRMLVSRLASRARVLLSSHACVEGHGEECSDRVVLEKLLRHAEVVVATFPEPSGDELEDFWRRISEGAESNPETVQVPLVVPQRIAPESWLNEDRFRWFRGGHRYAETQTYAIPALAACPPEALYSAVWAILRGAGLPDPEATSVDAAPEFDP